jgi:hypothetical protein
LEVYYKEEENRLNRAEKEVNDLKNLLFRQSQESFKQKTEEQNLLSELNGAKAADRNLQAKITRYPYFLTL